MNKSFRFLFVSFILMIGLAVPLSAQQAMPSPDDEIANAPVHTSLAVMNQTLLGTGTTSARVTQMALMVSTGYPPGQPTLYVADLDLRIWTEFVANDLRRGSYVGLEWTFDTRRSTAYTRLNGVDGILTSAEAVHQTRLAMNSWVALPCYGAYFAERPYPIAPGYENVEWADDFYLGLEAQPFRPVAEITVGGFLPYTFFRQIYGGPHGDNILGVTFAYSFYDHQVGQYTDIDHNGKLDTFWTEIYFNDLYYWGDATAPGVDPSWVVDLQTVASHETGHSFGLGHFGRIFENHGGFNVAGRNIMSQIYDGPYRELNGTPTGAFCGIYGYWQ